MKSIVWSGVFLLILSAQAAGQDAPGAALHLLDAVRTAVARHPALEIQKQEVEIGDAVRQQMSSIFDQVFATGLDRGRLYLPQSSASGFTLLPNETSQLVGSYSKLLRSGVAILGSVDMRQTQTAALREGFTTSSSRLQVVVPLMRGRGTQVTTSGERTAGLQRDSSVLDLRHVTATLMTRVVSSYWALVAAEGGRAVAAASAARGALLVENTRALIAADQTPRGNLASVLANAADREAARFVAEQAYVEARQRLLLDMGYRLETLPAITALDDFSLFGDLPNLRDIPEASEPLAAGALERRADYAAAKMRVEAARVARDGARNGLLPQIDFSLDVGYTSLAAGRALGQYFSTLASGVEGTDVVGRVTYRFPAQNSLASGRFAQADAQLRQAALTLDDLAGTIRASVIASHSALRNSVLRLERARESVQAFQEALRGEQDRLALGVGSIVSLLTIEDRLTASAEREVAAWRSYGQTLVEFRFATGSLVPVHDALPALDLQTFTTIPAGLAAGRQ